MANIFGIPSHVAEFLNGGFGVMINIILMSGLVMLSLGNYKDDDPGRTYNKANPHPIIKIIQDEYIPVYISPCKEKILYISTSSLLLSSFFTGKGIYYSFVQPRTFNVMTFLVIINTVIIGQAMVITWHYHLGGSRTTHCFLGAIYFNVFMFYKWIWCKSVNYFRIRHRVRKITEYLINSVGICPVGYKDDDWACQMPPERYQRRLRGTYVRTDQNYEDIYFWPNVGFLSLSLFRCEVYAELY